MQIGKQLFLMSNESSASLYSLFLLVFSQSFFALDFKPVEVSVKLPFLVVCVCARVAEASKPTFLVEEPKPVWVFEGAQVTPSASVAVTAAAATSLSTLVEIPF
jgi:hypothetical protein